MRRFTIALAASGLLAVGQTATAAPVQWGGNGHWYDVVAFTPATWSGSLADAATRTHLGLIGYLATITSQGEQDFIHGLTTTTAWIAASDEELEGTWKWMGGPEAGTTFYVVGAAVQPGYSFWNGGEPNNLGNEDYGNVNWNGATGQWNDLGNGGVGTYIVEFSPQTVPEPASLSLFAMAAIGAARALRRRSRA